MLLFLHARQTRAQADAVAIQQAQCELLVEEHYERFHDNLQPQTRTMKNGRIARVKPRPSPSPPTQVAVAPSPSVKKPAG
jgi:hypothetical protein